jgi:cold shock CspA family protein
MNQPLRPPRDASVRHTGVVKFYRDDKKYGFISRPGQPDIFFHQEGLVDRYDPPELGDEVSFVEDLDRKPNRLRAVSVERL